MANRGKKNKKPSFISLIYHNITARYNGYYNSLLVINNSVNTLTESHTDNYKEILDLFPFTDTSNAKSISPEMDLVIKKTSKVTDAHFKSKWTDDCYLLLGEAYFYKGNYENSLETFLHITTNYQVDRIIEKKTKRTKKAYKKQRRDILLKKMGMKHKPIYHKAILWLIHAYIQSDQLDDAQTVIEIIQADDDFPEKLRGAPLVL